ncbi:MAG: glutamine-hydrolyzing GMP synthase [Chlamydiota bacterium]|nr:glutamine-hydrolyzing GMP synthase [Chlamydiota bacterium]
MQDIEHIAILDFGSQYTQLIARRLREMNVYTEILSPDTDLTTIKASSPKGIILSGGPGSTHSQTFNFDENILNSDIPILGICYGMQLMNTLCEGSVSSIGRGEYGKQFLSVDSRAAIFRGLADSELVWMSHGDSVENLSPHFHSIANSTDKVIAAIAHKTRPHFGVQFHPEVSHTPNGCQIINNFVEICRCSRDWNMENYIESIKHEIKEQVGDGRVVSLISGGVDSTASTLLCYEALGKERVFPIHIDNGLMRKGESESVVKLLKEHGITNIDFVDASDRFLDALKGVTDPEEKRRIIGNLFIEILEKEIEKFDTHDGKTFFCQGTLYTDLIESGKGCGNNAAVIKTHHNVNPPIVEAKRKQGLIVEPNKHIFKDEVRMVCESLGVPHVLAWRHPFPGPGLAIRIIGEIQKERLEMLREADEIYLEEIRKAGWYDKIWQAFAILLPVSTVGVMGDKRTQGNVIALRAVSSKDGMTADFSEVPYEILGRVSTRIINEIPGINRVVYDVTSKPPGTIEWE